MIFTAGDFDTVEAEYLGPHGSGKSVALVHGVGEVRFGQIVRIPRRIYETIDVVEKYDLSSDERTQVMRNLIEGGDVTQWGLTNAVTRIANDVESYDRAVELEEIGGKVVALPAHTFGAN